MKIFICSCLFYLGMNFSYLPKNNKSNSFMTQSVGRIIYHFYRQIDSLNSSATYDEEMALYFDKSKSVYTSYRKLKNDSAFQNASKEAELRGNSDIKLGVMDFRTSREEIFLSQTSRNLTVGKLYKGEEYFIDYTKPDIDWKILENTKKISGLICQKAIGSYKGRKYTAWFTTDIPYGIGPWKLGGLPGAILEATDEKNQIKFLCLSVTKSGINVPVPMEVSSNGTRTTDRDFQKMVKAMEDGNGSTADNNGFKVSEVRTDGGTINSLYKKPVDNNPIELRTQ